ncbi:MAG: nucleotidyltransferase domain-containing protein [Microthrixaceae bacterium]
MRPSVVDQLGSHVQKRREWLEAASDRLAEDPRVLAALLYGSFGRGTEDQWSDIDIIVFIDDDGLAEVVDDRLDFPASFGRVLYLLDSTWNAPIGGGQVNALYDVGSGLPLYVDWNFWPMRMAGRPEGTAVIVDRSVRGLTHIPKPFEEWATYERQPRPAAHAVPPAFVRHAHFGMVPIAAKFVARRQRLKLAAMLAGIGGSSEIPDSPSEEIAAVRERLRALSDGQSKDAIEAVERLCATAEEAAGA